MARQRRPGAKSPPKFDIPRKLPKYCWGKGKTLVNSDRFPMSTHQISPAQATSQPQSAPIVGLTASAAKRIRAIVAGEGNPGLRLRLSISGGGCSGFQYGFTLDDQQHGDDILIERDGAVLVVDTTSAELMQGAVLDFVEDLSGAGFQVKNPQATASCGCGNSFAV